MIILGDDAPTARVQHVCCLCMRLIEPGEKYRRTRIVGYDGAYTFKECAHCRALIGVTDAVEGCDWEGYTADDIGEWEPETVREARWRAQWRRGWRRRDGSLYPVPEAP